jgi:hypothetical protein
MAKATEARAQQYEDALWYLLGLQEVQGVLSQKLRGGPDVSEAPLLYAPHPGLRGVRRILGSARPDLHD